ncbi:DUF7009 family protein [Mucilaginibacter calamicampi]|uniref:DUF7009 family protein n=1 Tax=Mucilaginibacter calamicampi TaxID=1302352 RepID=A0ABW2Z012_9SPHI
MKIRIKGNSLRFRLTRSDIATLGSGSAIKEQTEFLSKAFGYQIIPFDGEIMNADFDGDNLVLQMPKLMIDELAHTDKVGFSAISGAVTVLLEKDFTCLDNVDEDQSDNFPNPLLKKY